MSKHLASGRKPFVWIALVAIFSLVFGGISSAAPSWAEEGDSSPSPSSQVESQAPQAPESTQASEPESKDQTQKQTPASPKATPTQKVESSKAQKPEASKSVRTTPVKTEPKKSQAPPSSKTTKMTPTQKVESTQAPSSSSNRSSSPSSVPEFTFSISSGSCERVTVSGTGTGYSVDLYDSPEASAPVRTLRIEAGDTKTFTVEAGAYFYIPNPDSGLALNRPGDITVEECAPPAPVKDATADVTTSPATCEATGSAQVSGLANATLVGTLDQTVGTHAATFTANEGHLFADGSTTKTVEYTVLGQLTGEQCGVIPPSEYLLETSHTQTCGSVTITLRNVSPWIYPVSYSTDGSEPNASGPNYGPVVDNRTNGTVNGPAKDQTGSKTLTFTEDQGGGQVTVKYVVAAGTESDLYRGKPVGTVTTVLVNTNCQPDPVPVKPVGVTKIELCEPASGPTPDGVVLSEDPNFTYKNKATGEQLETGFNRVEGASITIVAVPKAGVIVKEGAQTEWTFEFTKDKCAQDDVYAPEGSVSVSCADGSAVLDNRKSTVEVVYQLVRNGKSSYHAVPAGEIRTVEFTGGEGIKVALWALDALLDEAASPAKCSTTPPTTPPTPPTTTPPTPPTDNRRPNNRPPTTGGASDDSSLALGALASGVFLMIGVALAATRRRGQ